MATAVTVPSRSGESSPAMPQHRIDAFRRVAASRLRAGATAATLLREQQALVTALADPDFATAMATAFTREMAQQQPNTEYAIPPAAALAQMKGILKHRIADAGQFVTLLGNPAFLAALQNEAANPAPVPKPYDLPTVKKEEIIRRLVQPLDQDGAEPAVHVAASALGQRQVHMALANIFRPKAGNLRAPLVEALARAWPEATGEQREQLATGWLKARHDPAHSIADGLKPGDELYEEAIRRAAIQQAPHAQLLKKTTHLNPALIERKKTAQEKAEDVIYTLNHSITCLGVTDTFGLTMAANAYNWVTGANVKIEHDHNTGYSPFKWIGDRIGGKHKDAEYVAGIHQKEDRRIAHDLAHARKHEAADIAKGKKPAIHPDPAPKLTPEASSKKAGGKFLNNSKKWLLAEAVGDLGAVPFTIGLQRVAPGFMNTVRQGLEPVIGGAFRKNTHRSAVHWGAKHGLAEDSNEVKDYGNKLYEYEMRHMPQMAVWTLSSVALNFGAMHAFHRMDPCQFEKTSLKEFAMVKGLGAAMTAGLVLAVRGFTPNGAHKWDQTVGKKVVVPITKGIGGLFGVKAVDVDDFQKKRADINTGTPQNPTNEVTEKTLSGRIQEVPAAQLQ